MPILTYFYRAETAFSRWKSQPSSKLWTFSGSRVSGLFMTAALSAFIYHLFVDVNLTARELGLHVIVVGFCVTLVWVSLQTFTSAILRKQDKNTLESGTFWIIALAAAAIAILVIGYTHSVTDTSRAILAKHLNHSSSNWTLLLLLFVTALLWTTFQRARLIFWTPTIESHKNDDLLSKTESSNAPVLILRVDRQDVSVDVDLILYVKAVQNYSLFCVRIEGSSETRRLLTRMTLKQATQVIGSRNFITVHRSYIINLNNAQKIEVTGNRYFVQTENSELVPISRTRRSETLNSFEHHSRPSR